MEMISFEQNIPWLPMPNEIAIMLSDTIPPAPLVTSALALAFEDNRLLC